MKVRMIFATDIEQDGKTVTAEVDTKPDVDDATAKALIDAGRAEPVDPPAPKPKA